MHARARVATSSVFRSQRDLKPASGPKELLRAAATRFYEEMWCSRSARQSGQALKPETGGGSQGMPRPWQNRSDAATGILDLVDIQRLRRVAEQRTPEMEMVDAGPSADDGAWAGQDSSEGALEGQKSIASYPSDVPMSDAGAPETPALPEAEPEGMMGVESPSGVGAWPSCMPPQEARAPQAFSVQPAGNGSREGRRPLPPPKGARAPQAFNLQPENRGSGGPPSVSSGTSNAPQVQRQGGRPLPPPNGARAPQSFRLQ